MAIQRGKQTEPQVRFFLDVDRFFFASYLYALLVCPCLFASVACSLARAARLKAQPLTPNAAVLTPKSGSCPSNRPPLTVILPPTRQATEEERLPPWQEALLVISLTVILLPVFLLSIADPMKPPVPGGPVDQVMQKELMEAGVLPETSRRIAIPSK